MKPIITTAELAAALDSARPPVLLDVRWRLGGPSCRDEYLAGHLPGAVFVALDTDLAAPPGPGGRHPLPGAAEFTDAMRRAGVRSGAPVVVYDEADGTAAARAWWLLRWSGHDDVRLLDGGLRAWTAAGGALEAGDVVPPPGDFTASPGHMPLLDAAGAAGAARDGVLLDARAAERFRGETEPIDPVAGHIPGAVSAPTTANTGADGRLLDPAALRERFAALGVTGDRAVGVYCGSGVTAAHQVLALELAGVRAALYADSWSGWITDPARPVAVGA